VKGREVGRQDGEGWRGGDGGGESGGADRSGRERVGGHDVRGEEGDASLELDGSFGLHSFRAQQRKVQLC
jgi:hypothetical protein